MAELRITFDVDETPYTTGTISRPDEFADAFPELYETLQELPAKTTWYIRLDSQLEALYGKADSLFERYADAFSLLRAQGHTLGWHYHAYRQEASDSWVPDQEEASVVEQIQRYAPLAKHHQLETVRMGWGYQSNRLMQTLDTLGFQSDSSAIPRPNYPWATAQSDWSITPQVPYHPAQTDYRRPPAAEEAALSLLEIPISTTLVKAPYDQQAVIRYLNPAYHPAIFQEAVRQLPLQEYPLLTTITHPYEVLPQEVSHGLLSFSLQAFRENLAFLIDYINAPTSTFGALPS